MMWAFVEKGTGKILVTGQGPIGSLDRFDLSQGEPVEIPEQDLSRLYTQPREGMPRSLRSDVFYPRDVTPYTAEERAMRVDAKTDEAIGAALHPFAPVGEQIGELRNALVTLFNALGIEPPAGFARFNALAIAEIEKGQAKKAVL
jgi:hypothetical protein